MKKLLFFNIILIVFSCDNQKISQLKNENIQLKLRIDSLSNALSESIKVSGINRQMADSERVAAEEQKQLAVTAQKVAEERRVEAESVRIKYEALLAKSKK